MIVHLSKMWSNIVKLYVHLTYSNTLFYYMAFCRLFQCRSKYWLYWVIIGNLFEDSHVFVPLKCAGNTVPSLGLEGFDWNTSQWANFEDAASQITFYTLLSAGRCSLTFQRYSCNSSRASAFRRKQKDQFIKPHWSGKLIYFEVLIQGFSEVHKIGGVKVFKKLEGLKFQSCP